LNFLESGFFVTFAGYWIVPKIDKLLKKKYVPITLVVTITDVIVPIYYNGLYINRCNMFRLCFLIFKVLTTVTVAPR